MSNAIQFHYRVGDDGVLNVQLNLGHAEAKKEVIITVEHAEAPGAERSCDMPWPDFVQHTYGSCAGLGLERLEQGIFETREPIA